MNTPIFDFVKAYNEKHPTRLHMPGHKGKDFLGCEKLDITEIDGADVLYSPKGIIEESELNATSLFSSLHSFYSTEGSSLCIKAMLTLIKKSAEDRPLILAARNVHKAFIYGCALLDIDVRWMFPDKKEHLCSCIINKQTVEGYILTSEKKPDAVYITSPDYLGNQADIKGIADICDKHDIPLLVDNAHGAYLRFLEEDLHPISLGATMCCDSAHKTLPVLTGGAYLHLSHKAEKYLPDARDALALHASTSPSYLILQSLDLCNAYLDTALKKELDDTISRIRNLKAELDEIGVKAQLSEPLKLTIHPLAFGYTGSELAEKLSEEGIVCEFSDRDALVMMFTPQNSEEDFLRLTDFFSRLKRKAAKAPSPVFSLQDPEAPVNIRKAMLSYGEYLPIESAVGRICAEPTVSCPPAVPICISGEIITEETIRVFKHYGFEKIKVMK